MSYDRLPPGLKEETTFCLYKLEQGKDGKKKKVPYQTCGARADPGNKAHLTDFTTAYETYCNGGYDGRYKTSLLMYAATLIAPIWQNRE